MKRRHVYTSVKTWNSNLRPGHKPASSGDQNRSRSFGNNPNQGAIRQNIPLNGILQRMANRLPPEPKKTKKPDARRFASRLTDEQVRSMRIMFRTNPMKVCAIAFDVPYEYARRILIGETHRYVI